VKHPKERIIIMSWLQGGPFLEISLIIKKDDVRKIITMLSNINGVSIIEENLKEKIESFVAGYFYDDEDITSRKIHSISLNIFVNVLGNRKSLLLINQVAEDTILIDFCFFGSVFDVLEWGQLGIKEDEYHHFINYLSELLDYFQGCAGAVAIENDILGLISEDHVWPDNVYNHNKINPIEILERAKQNKYIAVGIRSEGEINITSFVGNS
jgi:hypothetical protein